MDIESQKLVEKFREYEEELLNNREKDSEKIELIRKAIRIIKQKTKVKTTNYPHETIIDDRFVYLTDKQFDIIIKRKDRQFAEKEKTERLKIDTKNIENELFNANRLIDSLKYKIKKLRARKKVTTLFGVKK